MGAAAAQPWQMASTAAVLASMPTPAHAGGMFDFGITLPFVAITFLTMMATLNALWFAPVTAEVDDRNAKLLKTLSEATDMLSKADEIQVEYTEQIREARSKASAEVKAYREKTEAVIKEGCCRCCGAGCEGCSGPCEAAGGHRCEEGGRGGRDRKAQGSLCEGY